MTVRLPHRPECSCVHDVDECACHWCAGQTIFIPNPGPGIAAQIGAGAVPKAQPVGNTGDYTPTAPAAPYGK